MNTHFQRSRYLKYEQITGLSSIKALNPPDSVAFALITPESQAVRWVGSPTETLSSTVGYPLAAGNELEIEADALTNFRFIEQAAGAKLNVVYFGSGSN
jgi:hypothetical protein